MCPHCLMNTRARPLRRAMSGYSTSGVLPSPAEMTSRCDKPGITHSRCAQTPERSNGKLDAARSDSSRCQASGVRCPRTASKSCSTSSRPPQCGHSKRGTKGSKRSLQPPTQTNAVISSPSQSVILRYQKMPVGHNAAASVQHLKSSIERNKLIRPAKQVRVRRRSICSDLDPFSPPLQAGNQW